LLESARIYFPDKIADFSEPSVGGMFLDMIATVGDSLSYYLDHSFRELDPSRAVEPQNIITHLRNAAVEIHGASPATVNLTFTIKVPAVQTSAGYYVPKRSACPVILAGTVVQASDGITFNTIFELDFAAQNDDGNFEAKYVIDTKDDAGNPSVFKLQATTAAVSGIETTESITIADTFVSFREITLNNQNISAILDVEDSEGNNYYEVSSLSEDTLFLRSLNSGIDRKDVANYISVIPVPYRFVKLYDPSTQIVTMRFGSGNADTLDNDIVPDPSDLSLNLFGKLTMKRFSIDPNSLLETQTLGISPRATTLSVRYRYGGGLQHNVGAETITAINDLQMAFHRSPTAADALVVRQSIQVTNETGAAGGQSAPSLEELQTRITAARKAQGRIVTREDVLARIYSLPAEFGRVYRAGLADNPINPLSILLYIASLDSEGNLTVSPDALKQNLSTYLNEYRLIGDAIDVLDAKIANFYVKYAVYVKPGINKVQVIQDINNRLANALQKKFFNIGQPFVIDDVTNIIINSNFVVSLIDLQVAPRTGMVGGRKYSNFSFKIDESTKNGLIYSGAGSIFELKFPDEDIIGTAY